MTDVINIAHFEKQGTTREMRLEKGVNDKGVNFKQIVVEDSTGAGYTSAELTNTNAYEGAGSTFNQFGAYFEAYDWNRVG